jgi:hypothetical protein
MNKIFSSKKEFLNMVIKRLKRFAVNLKELILRDTAISKFCRKNEKYWKKECVGEQYIYIGFPFYNVLAYLYQECILI